MTNRHEPTERPILFNGEMVRAILTGQKTETRRPVKPQPNDATFHRSPFGEVGDRLWVREAFAVVQGQVLYRADEPPARAPDPFEAPSPRAKGPRWTPSIHMPRQYSRLSLEILSVHMARLQEMSEDSARAEGDPDLATFKDGWNAIYGEQGLGWSANPWVWVVGFKVSERR
jgi:hypothetical protein